MPRDGSRLSLRQATAHDVVPAAAAAAAAAAPAAAAAAAVG